MCSFFVAFDVYISVDIKIVIMSLILPDFALAANVLLLVSI